jgi:pimeloyl-ACP methyl ester carboxylesterase
MLKEIKIPHKNGIIKGNMYLHDFPKAWIIFAHGSGSSRLSKRNNWVAEELEEQGFSTLLFDLLNPEGEEAYLNRFNIPLLCERLLIATSWLIKSPHYKGEKIGYFGASTGAAAALMASVEAKSSWQIYAIVSRGGRPDLVDEYILNQVNIPTLLIVGGHDVEVIKLNEEASNDIVNSKIVLVPGATHFFEEKGALEDVARLASDWFLSQLDRWEHQPRLSPGFDV